MTEERAERQSSVKVSRNAKGECAYEIKIYFDEEVRQTEEVVKVVKRTMDNLRETFK